MNFDELNAFTSSYRKYNSQRLEEAVASAKQIGLLESPVEEKMAAAFIELTRSEYRQFCCCREIPPERKWTRQDVENRFTDLVDPFDWSMNIDESIEYCRAITDDILGAIFPQVWIGAYRVDFLILYKAGPGRIGGLVVECNGHAFHERTKEQVQKNYRRARQLQSWEYAVFPYSGSEIYWDAFECAGEVLQHAHSKAQSYRD